MSVNCVFNPIVSSDETSLFGDFKLKEYIKKISEFKSLTVEEEQECAKKAKDGDEAAKEKLIKANLKLVVTIAKKVIHTSKLPMIDLIQEGNIGLMVAINKFNWKFGYRFSTYACWWIKQAMFKAISEQSHCVKIPVYIQETLSKYSKVKAELEKNGNEDITVENIAKKMNIDSFKINNYLNAYKKTLSLEGHIELNNGSEVQLIEIIEDKKSNISRDIENNSVKKEILNAIAALKEREQKVILFRFGLDGKEKQTLEDIGKFYGVTKECIRQTELRALNKLRQNKLVENLYANYNC